MIKLKRSGFKVKFRKQIVDSVFKAFDKMLENDKSGEKHLFRGKNWNKESRKLEKEYKRKNWYKNSPKNEIQYTTVLFVPVTKGAKLLKEVKRREEEVNRFSKDRVKFLEDGGVRLKDLLIEKDPFPTSKCDRKRGKKCFLCDSEVTENPKFACNSKGVGYQMVCDTCECRGKTRVYEGETGRSARIRGDEHLAALKKQKNYSVLFKHKENEHKNEEMRISMRITKRFKDPLSRQGNEAVRISSRNKTDLLNSKSEFHHPPITRVTVEKNQNIWKKNGCDMKTTLP